MLRRSPINEINNHTHTTNGDVKWLLCMDKFKFHVFVVAVVRPDLYIDISWNKVSTLTFEPFKPKGGEECYLIGSTSSFCKLCIEDEMMDKLGRYNLFQFNCRTVSFLILVLVGFKPRDIFEIYKRVGILCGLDASSCLQIKEVGRFIEFEKYENGCTLF